MASISLSTWKREQRALCEAGDVYRLRQRQVCAALAAVLASIFCSVFF